MRHDSIACLAEIGVWWCFTRSLSLALSLSFYLSHVTNRFVLSLSLYIFRSPSTAYLSLTCMWCYTRVMNESCRTHECVMLHTRICSVTHKDESCHAFLSFSLLHARALSISVSACDLLALARSCQEGSLLGPYRDSRGLAHVLPLPVRRSRPGDLILRHPA